MITSNSINNVYKIKEIPEKPSVKPAVKVKPAWEYTCKEYVQNGKKWDICYTYQYPYGVLCNFTPSHFNVDGVEVNSMEGFLQSLKVKDVETQRKICKLPGTVAKKAGNYLKRSEQFDREHLYWCGKEFSRYSKEYQKLLSKAYKAKYSQDSQFRTVLKSSKGYTLTHDIGKTNPNDTVLTEKEFIDNLNKLRDGKNRVSIRLYLNSKIKKVIHPYKTSTEVQKSLNGLKTTVVNDKVLCGENIFSDNNIKYLDKQYGIKNVIEINASEDQEKQNRKSCTKKGITYLNVPQEPTTETIQKLIKMYNGKGIIYISSDARQNANFPLALNYLFNPKATFSDAILFGTPRKQFIKNLKKIKNQISEEQLSVTNKSKNFDDTFNDKITTLVDLNV